MASYLELARLMDKKEKQVESLAKELTIKEMVGILNSPDSTLVEQEVVFKAAQLLSEAENGYLMRQENHKPDEMQDKGEKPSDEELQKLAHQLFGEGD